jgi:rod shape-determining protein MreC
MLICCVLLSAVTMVTPGQATVAAALRRTIVAPLLFLQEGAQRWRTAWLRRETVMLVADSSAMRVVNAQALEIENAQLRDLIGLGKSLGSGFVPAEALQTSAGEDYHFITTLTLTAGTNAGVHRYSPVITADGVVGVVETVDPTISVAILYTNPDFRVSAMSADGTAFGIVSPHQGVTTPGQAYLLELRDVPFRSSLKVGVPIYTAGIGGVWPVGIPVGTIVRELAQADGLSRTYLVAPAVNPSKVSDVIILTQQREAQGVGNIWASAIGMDSATKRIVAAGDSLARQAVLLQAQARAAAMDSMKRATIDSILRVYGIRDTTSMRRDSVRQDSVRHRARPDSGHVAAAHDSSHVAVPHDSTPRRARPDTGLRMNQRVPR